MTPSEYRGLIELLTRHFTAIDQHFAAVHRRFDAVDRRFDSFDRRSYSLETELREFRREMRGHFQSAEARLAALQGKSCTILETIHRIEVIMAIDGGTRGRTARP